MLYVMMDYLSKWQTSFWRVLMMLFFGLHLLIVASVCTTNDGCAGDTSLSFWHSPVLTLAACYVLVDAYELIFVVWRKIIIMCQLFTVAAILGRMFLKLVIIAFLYSNYPGDIFLQSAWWVVLEQIMTTKFAINDR